MNDVWIELTKVTKRFGARTVVTDLDLTVQRGEILGLLGPNGSGKTTTIRLINGVIRPDSGSIRVGGYDAAVDGDAIRRISGILTESAGLYPSMTALDNLRFYADLYEVTDHKRPAVLLEQFGLAAAAKQKVGTFSTGMKKRLGLAKALLHDPEVLFLDEPTNGLDPEGIRMVLSNIRELNREHGTTIILCSHLLQQLETVCQRYIFIDGGRLIDQGTLEELDAKYDTEVTLEVETAWTPKAATYHDHPVRQGGPGRLELTLPGRQAVPEVLRQLAAEADLFGARLVGRDLESLYFKIRKVADHE